MSGLDVEDGLPARQLTSAELPDATICFLKENLIGEFKVQIGPNTRHPEGDVYLKKLAEEFGFEPPRETTSAHEDGIDESYALHEISSHDFPIIVVVPENEWRDRNGREESGLFTFEEALAFLANANNLEALTEEECRRLMLILLDGRARFKVLLRESQKSGKSFECFFQVYKASVLLHRQAFYELLHGKNDRHSYYSLGSEAGLGGDITFLSLVRGGDETARTSAANHKLIGLNYHVYTSSRSRTLLASKALCRPLCSYIVENAKEDQVTQWFKGAASPVLFVGLADTLSTIKQLDPSGTIFDATFYFLLFKVLRKNNLSNPLADIDPDSESSVAKIKQNLSEFAAKLKEIRKVIHPGNKIQLKPLTDHIGCLSPPWIPGGTLKLDTAKEFFPRFDALVARLGSDVSGIEIESKLAPKLITFTDLISLAPDKVGTATTRYIALCEPLLFTPLYEYLSACLQLAKDEPTLDLPPLYKMHLKDVEPFIVALLGGGFQAIGAMGRSVRIKEPWFEDEACSDAYAGLIRNLWLHHEEIVRELFAAKARVASLEEDQRKELFDHFVDPSLQQSPQGRIIKNHLHLAFLRLNGDRSLSPLPPPPTFERCTVWMRPSSITLLQPLAKVQLAGQANHFSSYPALVEANEKFPILDCPSDLESFLKENVENATKEKVGPVAKVKGKRAKKEKDDSFIQQGKLFEILKTAILELKSFKTKTFNRPDLPENHEEEEDEENSVESQKEGKDENAGDTEGSREEENDVAAIRRRKGKWKASDQDIYEDGEEENENAGKGKEKEVFGGEGARDDSQENDENVGSSRPRRKKKNVDKRDAAFEPTTGSSKARSSSDSRSRRFSPPIEEPGLPDISPALETSTNALGVEDEPERSPSRSPTPAPPAPATNDLQQNDSRSRTFDSSSISAGNDQGRQPSTSRSQDPGPSSSSAAELGAQSRDSTPNSSSSPALDAEEALLDNASPSRSSKAKRSTSSALEDAEEEQRSVTLAASSFVRGAGGARSNSLGPGSTASSVVGDGQDLFAQDAQLGQLVEEEEDLQSKLDGSESVDRRKSSDTVVSETDAEEDSEEKSEDGGAQSGSASSSAFERSKSSAIDLKPIDPRSPSRSVTLAPSPSSANNNRERDLRTSVQSSTPGSSTSSSEDREELRQQSRFSTPDASVSLNLDPAGAQIDVDSSSRLSTLEFSISFAPRGGEQDPRSSTLASNSFASSSSSGSSSFAVARVLRKDRFPERYPARLPSTSSSVKSEEEDVLASSRSVTEASSSRRRDSDEATTPTFDSSSIAVGRSFLPHLSAQVPSASSSSIADTSDIPSLSRSVTLAASSLDGEAERSQSHSDSSSSDNSLYLSFDNSSDQSRSLASDDQSSQEVPANKLPGWTTARQLRDDKRRNEILVKMEIVATPLVTRILHLFHQSDRYPALATADTFREIDLPDFRRQFKRFVNERGALQQEETATKADIELKPFDTRRLGWSKVLGVALLAFFEMFDEDQDPNTEVYQFWFNFGADFVREN